MKAALLVIDMQNDFRKGNSDYSCPMLTEKLVQNVKNLIDICKSRNIPVIYTQHSIEPTKSNAEVGEPENVRACIIGTTGWNIIGELKPEKGDFISRKHRADSFFKSELENMLKKLKVDTVIICGVFTNNCVRATAEAAYARNYRLILVPDCCGAADFTGQKSAEWANEFTIKELKERTYGTQELNLDDLKSFLISNSVEARS